MGNKTHYFLNLTNGLERLPSLIEEESVVKKELYEKYVKPHYNVAAVFDDRLQVCRMWHEEGLPLFRVGDPDADF